MLGACFLVAVRRLIPFAVEWISGGLRHGLTVECLTVALTDGLIPTLD